MTRFQRRYERLRDAGRCVRCGDPALAGMVICEGCKATRDAHRERSHLLAEDFGLQCEIRVRPERRFVTIREPFTKQPPTTFEVVWP